jgi:CheY-like chemotaxis protein
MSDRPLSVLLVEDDPDALEQFRRSLPSTVAGVALSWEDCSDFDEALERISTRRYDLIVTDIYRDRKGVRKGISPADESAADLVAAIRDKRFCPIVAFTDGSAPERLKLGPFVRFADKSGGDTEIVAQIGELLATGIPQLAQKLHDDLDKTTGSYLWSFLEANWEKLQSTGLQNAKVLERVIRKRAAMQLARIDPAIDEPTELETIDGAEFYIWPSISQNTLRLGEILQHKGSSEIRVILTPHCHLTVQQNASAPRADFVLTVKAVSARAVFEKHPVDQAATPEKRQRALRKYLLSPASVGQPMGRYWFLPGFLTLSDCYCDLLQLESVPYASVRADYERIAVLDSPFAEALQSCFTRFYSVIGLANLQPERFEHLITPDVQ